MPIMKRVVKITAWHKRELVEALGDTTGMTVQPVVNTVWAGRLASIEEWTNEETGDGWEVHHVTVPEEEL